MSREYISEVYELGLEREGPISKLECKGGTGMAQTMAVIF